MNEQEQMQQQGMANAYEEAIRQRDTQISQQTSAFSREEDENLFKWQLEVDNILERIDHLLRGHILKMLDGSVRWVESTNPEEQMFNDYGVNEILRTLSMYVNRNTILSNLTEEQVEFIVYDATCEINDLILCKYEDMGLNMYKKNVLYPMIVTELEHTFYFTLLRALKGGQREALTKVTSVNQTMGLGMGGSPAGMAMPQRQERGFLNPLRYVVGKYK